MSPKLSRRHDVFDPARKAGCVARARVAALAWRGSFALLAAFAFAAPPLAARANAQTSFNTTLLAQISIEEVDSSATSANDVTGYTDPNTGNEYAIIGVSTGTGIFNVTNTDSIYRTGFIPGPNSLWHDFASYRNYLYVGSEGGGGIQIIDLADPEAPVLVATYTGEGLNSSHTVTTDTLTARLYASGANISSDPLGTYILSIADPVAPVHLAIYTDQYIHDTYARGDTVYLSAIASGQEIILDASDPADLDTLAFFTTERDATHNSWPSEDGRYLYVTDEVAGGRVTTWDITDPGAPIQIDGYSANPNGDAHNIYIKGDYGFVAHYADGLRVLDVTDPTKMIEVAFYDTYSGAGLFVGDWSAHPFTASGNVYLGDIQGGLFIVSFEPKRGGVVSGVVTEEGTGAPLADVQLRISGSGRTLLTDANGQYEFRTAEGNYTITASRAGLVTKMVPVTVTAGITTTTDFTVLDNTAEIGISTMGPLRLDLRGGESASLPITITNTGGGLLEFALRDEMVISSVIPGKRGGASADVGTPVADAPVTWSEVRERIASLLASEEAAIAQAVRERGVNAGATTEPAAGASLVALGAKQAGSATHSIPPLQKVLIDPEDDVVTLIESTAGRSDATGMRVGLDSVEVAFRIETAGSSFPDSTAGIIFLDRDQDPATGVFNPVTTILGGDVEHDIGAERVLIWDLGGTFLPSNDNPIPGAAFLLAADFSAFYGSFFGEVTGGDATISLDLESVGDEENMNFAGAVAAIRSDQQLLHIDYLPNAGHVVIGVEVIDAPWLSSVPDTGSLAGGDSAVVQIQFDAPEIAADTTLEATVIVMTNLETTPTIEIPVELHVDGLAPTLSVAILQNPIFSSDLEIVVNASEPLDAMPVLTLDSVAVALSGSVEAERPELRGSATLAGSGPATIMISGTDLLGNTTSKTETFVAYKVPASGAIVAEGPDGAVRLEAAEGAIAPGTRLILRVEDAPADGAIDASATRDRAPAESRTAGDALSRRVSIGPAALTLATPATITIPLDEGATATDAAIFRLIDDRWEPLPTFVSPDRRALVATTDRLGVFQVRRGADATPATLPARAQLGPAAPNPSSRGSTIAFALARPGPVSLAIFDLSGRRVRTLVDETRLAGASAVLWDGNDDHGRRVAAGTYLYRLETPEGAQARKITVLR